jgi:hypothetical protein
MFPSSRPSSGDVYSYLEMYSAWRWSRCSKHVAIRIIKKDYTIKVVALDAIYNDSSYTRNRIQNPGVKMLKLLREISSCHLFHKFFSSVSELEMKWNGNELECYFFAKIVSTLLVCCDIDKRCNIIHEKNAFFYLMMMMILNREGKFLLPWRGRQFFSPKPF